MKKFKSFKDFVKDVRGIKPPEHKYDSFEQMKEEIKKETEQKRINEAKDRKDPEPVIIPEEQKNRNNEMKIVRQINEVLKFRDPILEKMTYEIWLTIPQNKEIAELNEYHAKLLYEQDMDRADKVQAAGRASGGGVRKKKVTTEAVKYYWTPDLMPSCSLWLDADDASSITLSGSNISQWSDKSGNGNHYGQTISSAQPTLSSSQMNGKDVVACTADTTLQFLTRSATTDYADSNNKWTTFLVVNQYKNHGGSNGTMIGYNYGIYFTFGKAADTSIGSNYIVLDMRGHNGANGRITIASYGSTYDNDMDINQATEFVGVDKMLTARMYDSGTEWRITGSFGKIDGSTGYNVNENGASSINAQYNAGDGVWGNQYYAEIIHYARGLTDAECSTVETYLQNKWDITVATQSVDPVLGSDNSYTP